MKTISSVIFLSFLVLILLVTPVIGSDWVEYYRDNNNGNVVFYKMENVEKDGDNYIVQVREKRVYSKKGKETYIQDRINEGRPAAGYDKLSSKQALNKIDCKKQMMELLSIARYDTDDKTLYSHSIEEPEWIHIIPDTMMDALRKKVCE